MRTPFWKNATVYQIYPMSFYDSNGDGIGDVNGIIKKLDYVKDLGVDILWISPIYQSPMDDNGYDVSDYYAINPIFGTMEETKRLIEEIHCRGMYVIFDVVLNHTSDEHPWFIDALQSEDSAYRDFYIFRQEVDGHEPDDQISIFSGSCWEKVPNSSSYYYHLFSKKQPDLNWDNRLLKEEIYKMLNFWLDLGIDGFRLDVIDLIGKDIDNKITANGPTLHSRLKEIYKRCYQGRQMVTVGETGCVTPDIAIKFTDPKEKELDMVFQFQHVGLDQVEGLDKWNIRPLQLLELKEVLSEWQEALYQKGWNSLFWSNHDQPRIVSRWGDDGVYREKSAKMFATLLHFMQGTPYIYQGEEIGMTNVQFDDIEEYRDIEIRNMYNDKLANGWDYDMIMTAIYAKGRDNARTPMQWNSKNHAGFTTGTPWIKVNSNYPDINVEKCLEDSSSIYYYYKKIIALRKTMPIIVEGQYTLLLKDHPNVFAYTRTYKEEQLLVICNFYPYATEIELDDALDFKNVICIISNDDRKELTHHQILRPYEACVWLLKK